MLGAGFMLEMYTSYHAKHERAITEYWAFELQSHSLFKYDIAPSAPWPTILP